MTATFVKRAALALVAVAALGGCSLIEDEGPPLCPAVNLLKDADRLVLFRDGDGRDLTDMRFEIDLEGYATTCEYDLDDGVGTLAVQVQPGFVVRRGPADLTRRVDIPFFVVLRDANDGTPIEKAVFSTPVTFEGNQRQIGLIDEPVDLTIPILEGRDGGDFSILLGLQLTPAELDYNRSVGGS
jgi:hypothetical protein